MARSHRRLMDEETFFVITSIVIVILTLITIVFALATIGIIVHTWRGPSRSITNLLTCNSCVALLYHSLATVSAGSVLFHPAARLMATRFCQLRAFMYFNACTTSSYSYLIQAISRYFITIRYKRRTLLTFRVHCLLIVIDWTISAVIAATMFIIPMAYQYESESRMCLLTSKLFVSSFTGVTLAFCIPFLIITLLYALILCHTARNALRSSALTTARLKRNLKVSQNIVMFVCILGLGGAPYFICVVVNPIMSVSWPWYSLSISCISLSATLESLALFFSNPHVKTQFYALIHNRRPHNTANCAIGQSNSLIVRT